MLTRKQVFVAASITGGREALSYVKFIVKFFQDRGYEVPSTHNAADDPVQEFVAKTKDPAMADKRKFRSQNNKWIEECRIFVAEVSTPSHGVGSELERCILKPRLGLNHTPILCVYRQGVEISPHIMHVSAGESTCFWIKPYRDYVDLQRTLEEFLETFEKIYQ